MEEKGSEESEEFAGGDHGAEGTVGGRVEGGWGSFVWFRAVFIKSVQT